MLVYLGHWVLLLLPTLVRFDLGDGPVDDPGVKDGAVVVETVYQVFGDGDLGALGLLLRHALLTIHNHLILPLNL